MAIQTHLDEIIQYKETIKNMFAKSQMVLALISNNPNIQVGSDEAFDVADKHIFDYDYIDGTQTQVGAFVMIDVDMVNRSSPSVKDMIVYIQVAVSKSYMSLVGSGIKGLKGNRKDNLSRFVDLCINSSEEFGIGEIELESAITSNVPDTYTSKLLTYSIPDFARNWEANNL